MKGQLRVLIVEDNPGDIDLIRGALAGTGPVQFEVESVPRLALAIERLAQDATDLVITDLGLPDSQGLETFRTLRQAAPRLAIIVLTSLGGRETGLAAVREGAQDYLVKGEIHGDMLTRAVSYAVERMHQERKIMALAHYDPLTQLANRTLFFEIGNRGIAHMKRLGKKCAVLFIDLDHFKKVNDTLGHAAGDDVLKDKAARLAKSIRETDIAARFGGDEFLVFLSDLESWQNAEETAERIRKQLGEPRYIVSGTPGVTASIGIAVYPDHGETLQELLKNADTAMYAAKGSGRDRIRFFDRKEVIPVSEQALVPGDNILVVDDEPLVGIVFKRELCAVGYHVDSVLSGPEALKAAGQKKYALAFIDKVMPGMDGVKTCLEMNKISPDTALVFMTGIFEKDNIVIVHPAGLLELLGRQKVHYLYKPFASGEIVSLAMKALGEQRDQP